MALLRLPPSAARRAHGRVTAYLAVVEQQLEILGGLLVSLRRIGPNDTHREFTRYLREPLNDLLRAWVAVSDAAAGRIDEDLQLCCCWRRGGGAATPASGSGNTDDDLQKLLAVAKVRHGDFMHELWRARLAIFFGLEEGEGPQIDSTLMASPRASAGGGPPSRPPLSSTSSSSSYYYTPRPPPGAALRRATAPPSIFEGSEPVSTVVLQRQESSEVFRRFQQDYARLGAFALLPRNTFLLDVNLLVGTLPDLTSATSDAEMAPPLPWSAWLNGLRAAWVDPCLASWRRSRTKTPGAKNEHSTSESSRPPCASLLRRLRLPIKVALALVLSSLGFFFSEDAGARTPWAALAVAYSMTSHPGSSFRSGCNRVQGTVIGGMVGMAALKWLGATSHAEQVAVIAAWTFACAWHRSSALYGDAAVVAAFTAPIIMLGPILGEAGALLRVEQTVFGTFLYAVIDNLFWPKRAKHDLRKELAAALETLQKLWTRSFNIFLQRKPDPLEEAARARALHVRLQVGLCVGCKLGAKEGRLLLIDR